MAIENASGGWHRDLVRGLALAGLILRHWSWPWLRRRIGRPFARDEEARRFRRLLESAGVTAIKIGQYLAIRLDLLPAEYCRELARLFDRVPPMTEAEMRSVFTAELGATPEALFADFDLRPLAAASIAQVHRATGRDGRALAVKVQRPRVRAQLDTDFRNLRRLARLADGLGLFGQISLTELIDEIARYTLRETDFRLEARTARVLRAEAPRRARIPAVVLAKSTDRVLTLEYLAGVPLSEILRRVEAGESDAFARAAPGVPPKQVVGTLAETCLQQLFVGGLFHGDPHPANVLIEPDGSVGFVDFGIFGELLPEERERLADYVEALARGRIEQAFRHYRELVEPGPETDMAAYRRETLAVMAAWHRSVGDPALPPAQRLTAAFQGAMLGTMRRHGVRMRSDLLLFWRALAVLDATAQRLPADFDLLRTMARFFARNRAPSRRLLDRLLREPAVPIAAPANVVRTLRRLARPTVPPIERRSAIGGRREAARRARALAGLLVMLGAVALALGQGLRA